MAVNHDDDDDDRKDLTRLEDLSEFLHEEDPDINSKLGSLSKEQNQLSNEDASSLVSLTELEDDNPPELPTDILEESSVNTFGESHSEIMSETAFEVQDISEDTADSYSEETISEDSNESIFGEETSFESTENFQDFQVSNEEVLEDSIESTSEIISDDSFIETETSLDEVSTDFEEEVVPTDNFDPIETTSNEDYGRNLISEIKPENFNEVKTFAQNFSYGTIDGSGNPPFSIIVRNIKFKEDAEDILSLLQEFKIVTNTNLKETEHALSMGTLLIPQISEFTAIVLAHKFRKMDLDLEVGLSDAVHPSKSGEINPKGLTNKDSFNQNKSESVDLTKLKKPLNEMFVTNSTFIPGFKIIKYLGIEHAHTLIEANELERLTFVYKGLRDNTVDPEDIKYYNSYKEGHEKIHDHLVDELKQKAHQNGANALLSIQFSLNQVIDPKRTIYKLTCTCTKAIVDHE